MPGVTWNKDNRPFLTPPLGLDEEALLRLKQYSRGNDLWGSIGSWNPKDKSFQSFHLSSLTFKIELDESSIQYSDYLYGKGHPISSEISEIGKGIDEWFARLCDWVAVLTKQDLNYDCPVSDLSMPGQGLRIWTEAGDETSLMATRNVIRLNLSKNQDTSLSKNDFEKIGSNISNNIRPPENHLVLRDARDAARRGQVRKAAIDAGTAVEITLRNYALANKIKVSKNPTLGWYINNVSPHLLPADTKVKLVDVRNDATHYNATFNDALVPGALNIAMLIVESMDPLKL